MTPDTATRAPATPTVGESKRLADQLRIRSIEMADRAGSGHPTSSMSAADLVAVLLARHLRVDPSRPDELGNDRLLFSKGHASPLLYAALQCAGILDDVVASADDLVASYRSRGSVLEGHPTPRVPGVPAATGALGLGIAIGVGMATGHQMADVSDAHIWVVCGDGELAEGAVWEAVEHAGSTPVRGLTAIIDVNRLGQTGPTRHGWDVQAYVDRFAAFGWATLAIDGHDVEEIDQALTLARASERPFAIVARTEKGHGARETRDQEGKHGKPLDDARTAIAELGGDHTMRVSPRAPTRLIDAAPRPMPTNNGKWAPSLPTWTIGQDVATREAFGETLRALASLDGTLVAIDGEVQNSTGLHRFAEAFPERFVQAYIAEQLMVGAAIGLDATTWHPVVSTFGAFLTRAHDVLRMAAISRSSLTVVGSHAGVSIGEDGPSQMALEDLAMMRALGTSTVLSPCDANQTAGLLAELVPQAGIGYLRVMRGATPVIYESPEGFTIGGSRTFGRDARRSSADVTIAATGVTVHEAIEAAETLEADGVRARVLDLYSIKPVDREVLQAAAVTSLLFVVVEDHRPEGGLADAVRGALDRSGPTIPLIHLAVRSMPGSASPAEQRADAGIDAAAIVRAARRGLGR